MEEGKQLRACLDPLACPSKPIAAASSPQSTSMARPADAGKTKKLAADARATAEKKDSLWKEGEMLKLREELREAQHLLGEMREKAVRGALATKIMQEPAVDEKKKKKKKLVRVILPDACIKHITENPCMMTELSKGQMKKCPKEYRQSYAMTKIINAKKRAYHQALIEQHRAFGFAYDEVEVTDDDENDEELLVVKD